MSHCNLDPGAALFYEQFQGRDGLKDRYFIVVRNSSPTVDCFTTTTRDYPAESAHLVTEYVLIERGESCLPKRCFIDLRHPYEFDDIVLANRLRTKSVRHIGDLPLEILERLCAGISGSRMLARNTRQSLAAALRDVLDGLA